MKTDLGIDSHVLKEASNAAESLIEVMTFLQRMRDRLKNLLILLSVSLVNLFDSADIIF